jgi:hypothetical protein
VEAAGGRKKGYSCIDQRELGLFEAAGYLHVGIKELYAILPGIDDGVIYFL